MDGALPADRLCYGVCHDEHYPYLYERLTAKNACKGCFPDGKCRHKGGHEIFPPDRKLPRLFNWKSLSKYKVKVVYGEPIYPNGETPEEFMAKVREAVIALKNEVR